MGVYTRFKKQAEGFRALVELMESTPASRRQKMIEIGLEEDRAFTEKALAYIFSFQDILELPDLELTEVIAETPGQFVGIAIYSLSEEVQQRILRKAPHPKSAADIRDALNRSPPTRLEIGGGQMKMIETARKLERAGILKTKRIPIRIE